VALMVERSFAMITGILESSRPERRTCRTTGQSARSYRLPAEGWWVNVLLVRNRRPAGSPSEG